MAEPLKLMCILAHPDDETLGWGGTFAKYAAEGIETYLITATGGEGGWHDYPETEPDSETFAQIRQEEVRAAAKILGIKEVSFLNYLDQALDQANPAEVICKLAAHIRRIRPQVVTSFGPDGAYGHIDHIAISQFATAALVCAADVNYHADGASEPHRVSKFYYRVEDQYAADQYSALFGNIVMRWDGVDRTGVIWNDWAITTRINTADYWATVRQAILCHRTQFATLGGAEHLPELIQKLPLDTQNFYRVFSIVNGGRRLETDLFEGLR